MGFPWEGKTRSNGGGTEVNKASSPHEDPRRNGTSSWRKERMSKGRGEETMAFVRAAEKMHAQRGSKRRSTNAHRHDCKYARISSYTPPRNLRPTVLERTTDEDRNKFYCTTNAITSKSVDPIEPLPSDRTIARDRIHTYGKAERNGSLLICSMSARLAIRLLRDLSPLPSSTRWRISYPRTPAPPFWHCLLQRYPTTT